MQQDARPSESGLGRLVFAEELCHLGAGCFSGRYRDHKTLEGVQRSMQHNAIHGKKHDCRNRSRALVAVHKGVVANDVVERSEERRVGKECRL